MISRFWTRLPLAAAGALALLLAGSVELAAQDSDRFVIAVLPFAATDDGKAKDLQKEIVKGLDDLGPYTLVEEDEVNGVLENDGLRPGGAIGDAKSLEVGRSLDAKIIARGSLEKRGDVWVARSSFVDVATRDTQNLPEVEAGDIDDLAEKLVEAFNSRNQADKHVIFGRDYMRSENFERAITNFDQALEYDPNLAVAHYYKGTVYLRQDQIDPALASLEKAIEIDPTYINAYHSIGSAYLEKGDTTQARDFFEQLISRKGDDCDIQVAYGYVMVNQLGELEKGLPAFERAKSLCPDNAAAYQYLAYALPIERRDEKIDNFKRYLALSEGGNTDPEALQYLFGLYFGDERYEEARQTVDQALAADPANADLQLYAGIVRDKLGDYRGAIEYYNAALEINPDLERAYLFRGLAHKQLGNTAEFAQDLERAGRGQSGEIMANLFIREAAESLKQGRASSALEALNRATQLGGDGCAIAYYKGDAYYRIAKSLQGEDRTIPQNERARELFGTAISHLQRACGDYASYGQGLVSNSNQYIERVDLIIKKLSRSSS